MRFKIDLGKFVIPDVVGLQADLQKVFRQELQNVAARIKQDSGAGRTAEGGSLKPYSDSYKEAIDRGSVAGKAPGTHTPNLTATGVLLRSIVIQPGESPGEIQAFFQGSHPPRRKIERPEARVKAVNKRRAERGEDALKPHKAVRSDAQKAAGAARAKGARTRSKFKAAFGTGSLHAASGKKRKASGGDVQNAVIAQGQYDMGRDGWFMFSKQDVERIMARVSDLLLKLLSGGK